MNRSGQGFESSKIDCGEVRGVERGLRARRLTAESAREVEKEFKSPKTDCGGNGSQTIEKELVSGSSPKTTAVLTRARARSVQGFSNKDIPAVLVQNSVVISVRVLERLCRKLCLFRRRNHPNLEEVVKFLLTEIAGNGQMQGY